PAGPVWCTTPNRRPSTSARANSPSRACNPAPSLLPATPISRAARASIASSVATSTQSPAWITTSAASMPRHTSSGSRRARAGTWVSEMRRGRLGLAPTWPARGIRSLRRLHERVAVLARRGAEDAVEVQAQVRARAEAHPVGDLLDAEIGTLEQFAREVDARAKHPLHGRVPRVPREAARERSRRDVRVASQIAERERLVE